jgi:transposase
MLDLYTGFGGQARLSLPFFILWRLIMPETNQPQNFMEPDAQSGRTRSGAPDGPRQKRSKMQDRSEPLEYPGHETVAQFMATPKSLREFESVTAIAKHFNITTKTIYCWMKDDDVMRRAEWLSMRNKRHGDLSIRCRYEEILEKLIEKALTGDIAAMKLCFETAFPEDQQAKKSKLSDSSLEEVLERAEKEYLKHEKQMTPSWLLERQEREAAQRKADEEKHAPENPQNPPQ